MPEQPNIVLVTTDSQGWNAVGECGDGFVETPTIDSLASDGVRFDRTYVTSPVCGPSRTGLYTGRYPHAVGAWTNGLGIQQEVATMGEYLRRAGYRTAYVGKWHLDGRYFGNGEAAPGYEEEYWYDGANYREDVGEEFWEWYRSGMEERVAEHDVEELHERGITREDTWAGKVTDRALAFLEDAADDDRPYFLAVNYDEPHEPATCPQPYCDRYRETRYPLPDNYETVEELERRGKPERQIAYAEAYATGNAFMNSLEGAASDGGIYRPLYFGCAEFVDAEIGRVLDTVDRDDSVVAFTSDHGHYLGAHGLDLKHFAMYDEVTNVPMVISGPSIPDGEVTDALLSHVDVLPTFLDLAGADVPEALHGESFLDVTRDPTRDHRDVALVEHNGYGQARVDGDGFYPVRCLVTADGYKLNVNLLDTDELYDLDADPGELENRIRDDEYAGARDRLHDRLLQEMADTDDAFHGQAWADRPWRDGAVHPTHPG